jgi:predicted dehydrogenase
LEGKLRWGVVGTGSISKQITSDFSLLKDGSVVAVASRSFSSANAFADEFDIQNRFADYGEMLSSGIDAVL